MCSLMSSCWIRDEFVCRLIRSLKDKSFLFSYFSNGVKRSVVTRNPFSETVDIYRLDISYLYIRGFWGWVRKVATINQQTEWMLKVTPLPDLGGSLYCIYRLGNLIQFLGREALLLMRRFAKVMLCETNSMVAVMSNKTITHEVKLQKSVIVILGVMA